MKVEEEKGKRKIACDIKAHQFALDKSLNKNPSVETT